MFTSVRAWCVVCAVSVALWRLFRGVRTSRVVCALSVAPWRLLTVLRAKEGPYQDRPLLCPFRL